MRSLLGLSGSEQNGSVENNNLELILNGGESPAKPKGQDRKRWVVRPHLIRHTANHFSEDPTDTIFTFSGETEITLSAFPGNFPNSRFLMDSAHCASVCSEQYALKCISHIIHPASFHLLMKSFAVLPALL